MNDLEAQTKAFSALATSIVGAGLVSFVLTCLKLAGMDMAWLVVTAPLWGISGLWFVGGMTAHLLGGADE